MSAREIRLLRISELVEFVKLEIKAKGSPPVRSFLVEFVAREARLRYSVGWSTAVDYADVAVGTALGE